MGMYPKRIEPQQSCILDDESNISAAEDVKQAEKEEKYDKQLMRKYYVSTLKHPEVAKPQFANILRNTLYVSE